MSLDFNIGPKVSHSLSHSPPLQTAPQRFTLEVGTENENMDGDVGATVLALVWMGRYRYSRASGTTDIMDVNDDDETMDMRIKAEEWVKGQFGGGEEARRIKGSPIQEKKMWKYFYFYKTI
ncbi:MAG: hypothetical protein NXY57DRAFT_1043535 [Lentinula lateritia]|nr:MAG: hypothetical protein NXY57DRAFT_1043535 [Lentinula lateritia]